MNKSQERLSAIKSQTKREAALTKKPVISETERYQRIEDDLRALAKIADAQFEISGNSLELTKHRETIAHILDVLKSGEYL